MASARRGSILLVLLAVVALSTQAAPACAQSARRNTRILMLYGHDPNTPGARAFTHELQGALRREWPEHVEMYDEVLDFDRFGDRGRWPRFAGYLAGKYSGLRIDAVVVEGSIALQFAVERLRNTFPGVPIVYGIAFEPVVDFDALPSNVTGRRIPSPFAGTFMLARHLQPEAKRVVIVAGAAPMDTVMLGAAIREVTPLLDGMQLEVLGNWTYPSLLKSLGEMTRESFVILASFRKDWAGESFSSGDMIPSITTAAAVPVYGIARNWVGNGIVGGTTMEFASEGARTGHLLARVLQQPRGATLPAREVAVNPTVVDWRQLQRWNLSPERVPAGTTVLFKQPSPWERDRGALLAILGVTVAQAILISLLALERRKRIRAQQSLQEQAEYEQMLAALRTDAVRLAPDDSSHALEHAVARVGRYAAAESAELHVHHADAARGQQLVRWSRAEGDASSPSAAGAVTTTVAELPLRADGVLVGTLKLHGVPVTRTRSMASREGLEASADVLAAALARARSARALADSQGEVAHFARVATVGHLGAAVSHELRQPLSAMRMHAEAGALLLGQEPPDVHEARVVFRDIVNDNARAIEVIEHIRMLLRRDTGTCTPVSVNDVCREAGKLLRLEAHAKRVTIDFALADGLPAVFGDAVQLQQVVMNLTLNAIESASTSATERRVTVGTTARDAQVELEVSDTGSGLSPEVQQHLFESFFSTKESGLGMGLSIVHQIVERHRGQVQAQNAPGGGAIFRVTLPAQAVAPHAERVDAVRPMSVDAAREQSMNVS